MSKIASWWSICFVLLVETGYSMPSPVVKEPPVTGNDNLLRIAFGSCNNHEKSQAYWKAIVDYFGDEHGSGYPDAWIWAGDIVYADTESYAELEHAYATVKNSDYGAFAKNCEKSGCRIVGVWDDHDFGDNNLVGDLGPNPPVDSPFKKLTKALRKALLVNFLGEPTRSKTAEREQVYAAYDFVRDGVSVRLILLDLRYDRQEPGDDAKIMAQAQWTWLRENLMDESVDLHLIVSSTQVLRQDIEKDTWEEYPKQRKQLLELIGDSPAQGIVLLTGDIHAAEISRLGTVEEDLYGIDYPLYEITASGLNRLRCVLFFCGYSWQNAYREGFVIKKNFGEIDIAKSANGVLVLLATLRSSESPETGVLLRKNIRFTPR